VAIEHGTASAALAPATTGTLARMVRVVYPHASFPDGPYQRVAEKLAESAAEDAALAGTLEQGVRDLDAARGVPFTSLPDEDAAAVVRELAGTPFFATVRSTAVVALYDQPEVWALLGYEGPSFDQGGYLQRGFDDLDWLPDPPVSAEGA
jgi:hypothetical protein